MHPSSLRPKLHIITMLRSAKQVPQVKIVREVDFEKVCTAHEMVRHTIRYLAAKSNGDWFKACVLKAYSSVDLLVRVLLVYVALARTSNADGSPSLVPMVVVFCINQLLLQAAEYAYSSLSIGHQAKRKLRDMAAKTMLQLTLAEQERFAAGKVADVIDVSIDQVVEGMWLASFDLYEGVQYELG